MGSLSQGNRSYVERMEIRPMPISLAQRQFRNLDCWLRGYVGGRGAGKTRIGAVGVQQEAKPNDSWMVVSPDNNMIRETTLPTFIDVAKFTGRYIRHVLSPTPRVWFRTQWGGSAECVFKGAEVPDKLRGSNRSGIWFDEASIISEEAFQLGIATCRLRGKMGPCFATFTPRGFKHWTFQRFYQRIRDDQIDEYAGLVKFFQGRPHIALPNTGLVNCRSRDNPFLPQEFVSTIGQNYSSILTLQELDGEFVEISGLIFKREWFKSVDEAPRDAARVRYWDKAASASQGCFSVGLLMAKCPKGIIYIEDVVRGQWSYHDRNQIMLDTARRDFNKYGGTVLTYIEQEGGGDGKTVIDQLLMMLGQFPCYRDVVSGGQWKTKGNLRLPAEPKIRRALPFSAYCEAGNVRIVSAPWNADYIEELSMFPEYAYADQVDASSGSFNKLAGQVPGHLFASRDVQEVDHSRWGESTNLSPSELPSFEEMPWNQNTKPFGGLTAW